MQNEFDAIMIGILRFARGDRIHNSAVAVIGRAPTSLEGRES